MTKIGFLYTHDSASEEERAAWSYLRSRSGMQPRQINPSEVVRDSRILKSLHVLWWHFDSTVELPAIMKDPALVALLRNFTSRGGGLFLTLLASQYVVDLDLESIRPNQVVLAPWTEASWATDYPDMRGYAPFGPHPIFKGFPGGLYSSSPVSGLRHAAAYYENLVPAMGRVLAVEKCYIKLHEHRRVVMEYHRGRGRILTIGCHLQFAQRDKRFRIQRDVFADQCLRYLAAPLSKPDGRTFARSYGLPRTWNFNPRTVAPLQQTQSSSWRRKATLPDISSGLEIHRDLQAKDSDESFDLSGDRLVLIGLERGGISEAWCHPVRIMRQLEIGYSVGDGEMRWSTSLHPLVTIRPESFTRQHEVNGASFVETLFADSSHPAGGLCIHITATKPVELVLRTCIDLRLMWPLSEAATGSLRYRWDSGYGAAVVTNEDGTLCSIIGSSVKPRETCIGQFDWISDADGKFTGHATSRIQVSIGIRIALRAGTHNVAFFFGGSNQGEADALKGYRAVSSHPGLSLSSNIARFKRLEQKSIAALSPSDHFNRSLRWARWSLSRLLATTPGVGRSLMAGYGLTSAGWSGGHEVSGRPGYAWYFGRDSVWASLGLLASGDFLSVRQVLEFLGTYQEPTGKILHELTTSGFAHFDAADATPLYVLLMGRYVRASGDVEFCRSQFVKIEKAIGFCFATDSDGDGFIENTAVGHGWVEGGPLFPVHAEHYLQACWIAALEEGAFVARVARRPELGDRWHMTAQKVQEAVERAFWNSKHSFYRFAKLFDRKYADEKTVLSTVAMALGCARRDRSQRSLAEFAGAQFTTDWGVRILGRDHPSYKPNGYHSGSVWPLFTGWTALAEFKCGRPLQGTAHLFSNAALTEHFTGGCIEEVIHGESFLPTGVCPHQAWSESMVLQPFFNGMLGLDIDGLSKSVVLRPFLPPGWKYLKVSNIPVGGSTLGLSVEQSAEETIYRFTCTTPPRKSKSKRTVSLLFQPLLPLGTRIQGTIINGRAIRSRGTISRYDQAPLYRVRLRGRCVIRVRHLLGIGLVVQAPHLERGQGSTGIRIIEERWKGRNYEVEVEGRSGREYLVDITDPSGSVKEIQGGIALARSDGKVLVSVHFPGDVKDEQYLRTVLRVRTQT